MHSIADVAAEELDLVDNSEIPEVSALLSSSLFCSFKLRKKKSMQKAGLNPVVL
ncbi:MAG: hypothetical protein PSV35_04570 [bacterium]|nr:hypothetical protein [bacterium]